MQRNHSPLRYPGGKSAIISTMIEIIIKNRLQLGAYAEPFAGGCGLALGLLMRQYISRIYINDIDMGIWSFWHSVLTHNKNFITKMHETDITIEEWYKQREIARNPDKYDFFELGFATFFLNRTNRSGILTGGVIGGLKQNGKYLLDCRFNKSDLERRITRIGYYADKIELTNLDALDFLKKIDDAAPSCLLYIDPPYYQKGAALYTNFYNDKDHEKLSQNIGFLKNPWILTYDNEKAIKDLYAPFRYKDFNLNYSACNKHIGTEIMIFSDKLTLPEKIGRAA